MVAGEEKYAGGSDDGKVGLGNVGCRVQVARELDIKPDISETKLIGFIILLGLLCRL